MYYKKCKLFKLKNPHEEINIGNNKHVSRYKN